MIRPILRSLIIATGLAWAGCAVAPDPSASTSDTTTEPGSEAASSPDLIALAREGGALGQVTQPPNHGCGYECHAPTADILEVSWNFCLHNCPGGPGNCTSMPPPPCP